MTRDLIPAVITIVYFSGDFWARPALRNIRVKRCPVIGWELVDGCPHPIVPGGWRWPGEAAVLLEMPNGRLANIAHEGYASIEEVISFQLKIHQDEWDGRRLMRAMEVSAPPDPTRGRL